MKRITLLFGLLLFWIATVNAQVSSPTGVFNASGASVPFSMQTAGVTRATILNSGLMGIGTTTPSYALEVVNTTNAKFRVRSSLAPNSALMEVNASGLSGVFESVMTPIGMVRIGSQSNTDFALFSNNLTRMTVKANGNIAIGDANGANGTVSLGRATDHAGFTVEAGDTKNSFLTYYEGGTVKNSMYWDGVAESFRFRNTVAAPFIFSVSVPSETELMRITNTGNVGIGTAAPTDRLHVSGGNFILDNTTPTLYTGTGATELNRFLQLKNSSGLQSSSGLKAGGVLVADDYTFANPAKNDLVVKGKVGIGTPLAHNTNEYTLAVNGKIGTKDIQIESGSDAWTWPDYVFQPAYKLPSLTEVAKYINDNKHLPDVPSAEDVAKNGYSMSELDMALLKKVEELTLYILEQQKQIDELKKKVEGK